MSPRPLSILLQPLQVILPIRVTSEYRLALIATADHMVKRSVVFNPGLSRHPRPVIP